MSLAGEDNGFSAPRQLKVAREKPGSFNGASDMDFDAEATARLEAKDTDAEYAKVALEWWTTCCCDMVLSNTVSF